MKKTRQVQAAAGSCCEENERSAVVGSGFAEENAGGQLVGSCFEEEQGGDARCVCVRLRCVCVRLRCCSLRVWLALWLFAYALEKNKELVTLAE